MLFPGENSSQVFIILTIVSAYVFFYFICVICNSYSVAIIRFLPQFHTSSLAPSPNVNLYNARQFTYFLFIKEICISF